MGACAGRAAVKTQKRRWASLINLSHFHFPPAAAFAPPTVSDTKAAFYAAYRKPLPALYTPVVQELLVQHHLVKYNIAFQYDQVREKKGARKNNERARGKHGESTRRPVNSHALTPPSPPPTPPTTTTHDHHHHHHRTGLCPGRRGHPGPDP